MKNRLAYFATFAYLLAAHALFISCIAVALGELWQGLWQWRDLLTFVVAFHVFGFGISVFYHRYFTHNAFRFTSFGKWTARPLIAWAGMAAWQGPVKVWAAQHEKHHQHSDVAGHDPHGPIRSITDLLYVQFALYTPRISSIVDVENYAKRHDQRYDWFERYVCSSTGYLAAMLIPMTVAFHFGVLIWYLAAVGIVFHLISSVNSLGHSSELVRHSPPWIRSAMDWLVLQKHHGKHCASTLNLRPWVSWFGGYVTAGELNHNNHHKHANSAKIGKSWYDADLGWWLVVAMERTGLVDHVRRPPSAKPVASISLPVAQNETEAFPEAA